MKIKLYEERKHQVYCCKRKSLRKTTIQCLWNYNQRKNLLQSSISLCLETWHLLFGSLMKYYFLIWVRNSQLPLPSVSDERIAKLLSFFPSGHHRTRTDGQISDLSAFWSRSDYWNQITSQYCCNWSKGIHFTCPSLQFILYYEA